MKKIFTSILICLIVVFATISMTGCDNEFAKREYGSDEKIVQIEDRCSSAKEISKQIDGGYSLTISKFDGRETIWKKTLQDNKQIEMQINLSITTGNVKIVYIDSNNSITVLAECLQDISTEQNVTKTVSLTSGLNRLKIVGYDCNNIDLKILFDEP